MSQTGYQKSEFCLKQGRKISDICLKQGQGMRGRAAPPHPGIYRVTPPPGTKPACLLGDSGRDRPVVAVLSFVKASLRVLYISYLPTAVLVYIRTFQGWFLPSRPKIKLLAFIFCLLCNGTKKDC